MKSLRGLRAEYGLSQADLAATLDVAPSTVYSWERGTRKPSWTQMMKLARLFETPVESIDLSGELPSPREIDQQIADGILREQFDPDSTPNYTTDWDAAVSALAPKLTEAGWSLADADPEPVAWKVTLVWKAEHGGLANKQSFIADSPALALCQGALEVLDPEHNRALLADFNRIGQSAGFPPLRKLPKPRSLSDCDSH